MALITYADKSAMGTQPSIPAVNKVMDSDMNEIKAGINNSTTYSTNEAICGTWVDGSPLYRKVINFGALPDTSAKNVNHNISNFKRGIKITGYAYSSQSGNSVPIPYASNSNVAQSIVLYCNSTVVGIVTGVDHSIFDECYIILEYTKTS